MRRSPWALLPAAAALLAGLWASGPAAAPVVHRLVAAQPDDLLLLVAHRRHARSAVKPGKWEFTSRLQNTAALALPSGKEVPAAVRQQAGHGMKTVRTGCIESDNAVPADLGPQCTLDN